MITFCSTLLHFICSGRNWTTTAGLSSFITLLDTKASPMCLKLAAKLSQSMRIVLYPIYLIITFPLCLFFVWLLIRTLYRSLLFLAFLKCSRINPCFPLSPGMTPFITTSVIMLQGFRQCQNLHHLTCRQV